MSDPDTTGQIAAGDVNGIDEYATVTAAARMMAELGVDALPVFDQEGQLTGAVTVRDIVTKVVAPGRRASTTTVDELGASAPLAVAPTAGIEEITRTMAEHHVRRLPLMVGSKLVGIVTTGDQDSDINLSAIARCTTAAADRSRVWWGDAVHDAVVHDPVLAGLAHVDGPDAAAMGPGSVLHAALDASWLPDVMPSFAAALAGATGTLKAGADAVETPTVTDAGAPAQEPPHPAPRTAPAGAVIPLRTKAQVARRDALQARMDEDLARRKGTGNQARHS